MSALPPLNALRAFEAAARRGSFVAAAEELNVTPAAIGQQVRQLEALIGAPLFVREGRGVRLTERGAAGIDRLGRAFELMGEASSAMREASGEVELVIGAPADFAAAWLAPRLATREEGLRKVSVITGPPEAVFERGAELAIAFAAAAPAGYESQLLAREILAPMATPELAARIGEVEALSEVPRIEEAGLDVDWRAWLARRGAYGLDPAPALKAQDGLIALSLAEAGAGVVLARRSLAGPALAARRLVPVFADGDHVMDAAHFLIARRGRRLSAPAQAARSWLRAEGARAEDAADEL